jgi:hypothetical protein
VALLSNAWSINYRLARSPVYLHDELVPVNCRRQNPVVSIMAAGLRVKTLRRVSRVLSEKVVLMSLAHSNILIKKVIKYLRNNRAEPTQKVVFNIIKQE